MRVRTRDAKKEAVIRQKALGMFFVEGFGGFSMHKVARAASVSPATLYIYFQDRDDLILQLCATEMRKMTDATLDGFDPAMSFAQGLEVQWRNRARYYLKYPLEAHFLEQIRHTPFHQQAQKSIDPAFLKAMRDFVHGAIDRGELVRIPVEVYWSVAFAPLYQLLKFHLHGHSFPGLGKFVFDDETMNATLGLVIKALTP